MDKRSEKQKFLLEKARKTFLDKGLFNAVMDDIAESAGLTRRSLYRYFKTKEDMAYETATSLLNEWNAYHRKVFKKLTGNGLVQLESFLLQLIEHMAERRSVMKYLGEFDFYTEDEKIKKPSSESMMKFNRIILESDELLTQLITRGVEDGSTMKKTDIKLTVFTISNVLWSFGQRIAIRDDRILQETGMSGVELIKNQVSIYISALRAG